MVMRKLAERGVKGAVRHGGDRTDCQGTTMIQPQHLNAHGSPRDGRLNSSEYESVERLALSSVTSMTPPNSPCGERNWRSSLAPSRSFVPGVSYDAWSQLSSAV